MTTTNKDFKVKHGLDVANGGTFGGPVTVGTPTDPDHAATKDYVDSISLVTGPTGPRGYGLETLYFPSTNPVSKLLSLGDNTAIGTQVDPGAWTTGQWVYINDETSDLRYTGTLLVEYAGGFGWSFSIQNISNIYNPGYNPGDTSTNWSLSVAPAPIGLTGPTGAVGATGPAAEFLVTSTPPISPQEGQIWFDPTAAAEYVYYDGYWVELSGPQGIQGPIGNTGPTGALGPTGPTGPTPEFLVTATPPPSPQEGQIWFDPTTAAEYIYYDGTWIEVSGPQGATGPTGPAGTSGIFPSTSVSSDITLVSGNKYFVNTSSSRILTLPASPTLGDEIHIFDANGSAGTNNITVVNNSVKINGVLDSALIDSDGVSAVFIYTGSTYGWRLV